MARHCPCSHLRLLLGGGEWRILTGAGVAEPLFPFVGVVGPFLQLDAPKGRLWGEKESLALRRGQAPGDDYPGLGHQSLSVSENFRYLCCLSGGDDALAVW